MEPGPKFESSPEEEMVDTNKIADEVEGVPESRPVIKSILHRLGVEVPSVTADTLIEEVQDILFRRKMREMSSKNGPKYREGSSSGLRKSDVDPGKNTPPSLPKGDR